MKITVDTEEKTITVEEKASVKEIIDFIKSALTDSYEEYTIQPLKTVEFINVYQPYRPISVNPVIYPTVRPWGTEVIY